MPFSPFTSDFTVPPLAPAIPPGPPAADDRWLAWDRFLESSPETGFMQSSWWADFRVDAGYGHFGVMLKNRGFIVGGALVMTYRYPAGQCFYYIPEGPVLPGDEWAAEEVLSATLLEIEERRKQEELTVSHLRIEPRWERLPEFLRGFRQVGSFQDRYMEPRDTLCVDLRPPEEAILAQMKPKGRYNIGVARRHGVVVVEDTSWNGLADFLSIYDDMADRQGLRAKPHSYFERLIDLLAPRRRAGLFFAEHQGARIAAALVVYFGPRATYFFGGSLATHRNLMAPYLLHFEIMRRAKALGYESYDFWGVAPEAEPDHPWADISVFKRKFGGGEVRLVPTLDLVYDPVAYEYYVRNT